MSKDKEIQKLINSYKLWEKSLEPEEGVPCIEVDEIISKIAWVYEKGKATVNWQFQHLLRKKAIKQALKRRIFIIGSANIKKETGSLLTELIRNGYFPNKKIPESKIGEIENLVEKYFFIIKNAAKTDEKPPKLLEWLIGIMACNIEEILWPAFSIRENALINFATNSLRKKIVCRDKEVADDVKYMQIFIANQKVLFDFDEEIISYNIFKNKQPDFFTISDVANDKNKTEVVTFTKNIYQIWRDIESSLNHKLSVKFHIISERYDTPYLILGDVVTESLKAKEAVEDPHLTESIIIESYNKRYGAMKSQLFKIGIFSTVSIFLSNIFSLIVLEYPLTVFVLGQEFTILNIAINIFVPTLLMFLLVTSAKLPAKKNLDIIVSKTIDLVYNRESKEKYLINLSKKRSTFFDFVFLSIHIIFCFISYGILLYLLSQIDMPYPARLTFIIFISMIAFTGTMIRQRVKELNLIKEKESIESFILDMFSLPVTQIGKWFINKWSKYNFFMIIFNIFIDLPLNTFLTVLEEWKGYIKEEKEKTR